jgi:Flp pilus assembly pilin Flp
MSAVFARFVTDDTGQDLAEYGIALAIIGTIAGIVAIIVAQDVSTLWSRANGVVDSVATS